MAEINVERRPRSFWPWIIGLLVLAALAWLLLSMLNRDDDAPRAGGTDTVTVQTER